MIKHGNLKQNIFAALEIIDTLKGVSVGARLLAASVLRKHESWKISWSWFANQMGVAESSIHRWKDELCKAGVWEIFNKNSVKFTLNLQETSNLQVNKRDEFVNFNLQKENSLRAHDAHARGENLSDENSQNFTQMQNSTFAENATLQSENENFKADLNALNSGEIQANLSQNEQEKANLQGLNFVGEFSPNFANERSQNGVDTDSVGRGENDEFSNKAQNADLVVMSEKKDEQNAKNAGVNLCESEKMEFLSADEAQRQAREQRQNISVPGTQGEQNTQNTAQDEISDRESQLIETQSANAKYKGILEKFAGVIKGTPTPKNAKPKGTATQMSEYLKTQKRQNKAEKKQSARAMRLLEANEVFSERESEIKCFSKDDWDGWVEHKLARAGVHFTKQTWKNDIQKLIEASSGAKAMINHSIACAYQGLFAPRASGGGQMSEWQKQRQAQNEMLADW